MSRRGLGGRKVYVTRRGFSSASALAKTLALPRSAVIELALSVLAQDVLGWGVTLSQDVREQLAEAGRSNVAVQFPLSGGR